MTITATGLRAGYGAGDILTGVDCEIPADRVTTIIGPNGCGKSTLLRAMSQLLPIRSGSVTLAGRALSSFRRKELATQLSVLPQSPLAPEGLLVADLVARGRHPHQSWLRQWSSDDEEKVAEALELAGALDLAERPIDALSGGQRQRV